MNSSQMPRIDDGLPLQVTRQIDGLCDEFESSLDGSMTPLLAPYVERVDPVGRARLLSELAALALDHLLNRGVADPAETLLAANGELRCELQPLLADACITRPHADDGQCQDAHLHGLHIRCPHCSNPVELLADTPYENVLCRTCGSAFSLVGPEANTAQAPALQKLGRFEIVTRLGVGGFGTVWKARDTELDRVVAIKIPRKAQLDRHDVDQFVREARAVAQLRHPNIVPVHEVGREDDTIFIVSDFVRGVSLSDWLSGDQPSSIEIAELTVVIAEALHHAHQNGVIHRDVKPSNILLDQSGRPFVMDFGLAKREAGEITMTLDGQVLGTPAYMSPEQAKGENSWTDCRSDIYSLGVVLFRMLTGELPFRGNAQMQIHQRLTKDPPEPRSLNCYIPRDLSVICLKCLEADPNRRFSTAKGLADELKRYLDGVPILSRPISKLERLVRWAGRRPLQATTASLVIFLAVAGPTVALLIERQRQRLDELVQEKDNLITAREQENRAAIHRSSELEDQLDVWEGRANPWTFWPPDPADPPKRLALASLLAARGPVLERATDDDIENAQRFLALATLCEAANRLDEAEVHLLEASAVLKRLHDAEPTRTTVALALADCYDRLSALSADRDRQQSLQWLENSLTLRRSLADVRPGDPLIQASRLDAELRSGAAAGFENAAEQLDEAKKLDSQLSGLWPMSPAEIYRLACQLAGRSPFLAGEQNAESAATSPTQ